MLAIGERLRAAWSMVGFKKEEGHAIYYRFHDCDGYLALLCKSFQLPALSGLVGRIHLGIKGKAHGIENTECLDTRKVMGEQFLTRITSK